VKSTYSDAVSADQLNVIAIDDIASGDYSAAFKGVQALIHAASPTPVPGNSPRDIYEGATKGIDNVLSAAIKAGVKRIVLTSSAACLYAPDISIVFQPKTMTESDWGVLPPETEIAKMDNPGMAYPISKLAAELKFWDYADQNPSIDFSAILPPMVYGGWLPLIDPSVSTNQFIYQLITGQLGEGPSSFPKWPFPQHVHVSDVAKAHIKALNAPRLDDGRRKRFIVAQGSFTYLEAIRLLKRERPALVSRLPSEEDPAANGQSPTEFDTSFTAEILGMKKSEYIPSEKIWLEVIDQLVAWEKSSQKSA